MRQVREVLRLKYLCGQSGHRIAVVVGISRYTVAEYLRRAAVVGITWPVPSELDDTALERKLFTPPGAMAAETVRPQPDWMRIHAEMRRPGVTLLLLWEEYRAGQPDGYGYSRFCDLYAAWRGRPLPRGHRLPRRGVWTLVFRAIPADARGDRSADHRADRGTVSSRHPRRQPPPQPTPWATHDDRRAHAEFTPTLR
jgi:hypothetical protein